MNYKFRFLNLLKLLLTQKVGILENIHALKCIHMYVTIPHKNPALFCCVFRSTVSLNFH